jgi:hypothetical protein
VEGAREIRVGNAGCELGVSVASALLVGVAVAVCGGTTVAVAVCVGIAV